MVGCRSTNLLAFFLLDRSWYKYFEFSCFAGRTGDADVGPFGLGGLWLSEVAGSARATGSRGQRALGVGHDECQNIVSSRENNHRNSNQRRKQDRAEGFGHDVRRGRSWRNPD